MFYSYFKSPLGNIEIRYDENNIYAFLFRNEDYLCKPEGPAISLLHHAHKQLEEYFAGTRTSFSLPLCFEGTEFQKKVWSELLRIEFGKTISYLQLARALGDEKSIRAAASANGKNPFGIIVPCHRVIGTDGSLTGYAGELWRKQWLLDHEAKVSGSYQKLF